MASSPRTPALPAAKHPISGHPQGIGGPELVIGLIGLIGVDLDSVARDLERELSKVGYRTLPPINLIDQVLLYPLWSKTPKTPYDARIDAKMDAGNKFRGILKRNDAVALLALAVVQTWRRKESPDPKQKDPPPIYRGAYILNSLKTSEEVELLREVYGSNCFILSVYSQKQTRIDNLVNKIANSKHTGDKDSCLAAAAKLIARDQSDRGMKYGQNVRKAFPLADYFIDASQPDQSTKDVCRFVELLFGSPYRTPTPWEFGMFQAHGASLRSADAGRQVGASILNEDGEILAAGTNEVPKAFGGQYWEGDKPDLRDHRQQADANRTIITDIFADLLARLKKRGWLEAHYQGKALACLVEEAQQHVLSRFDDLTEEDPPTLTERAPLGDLIEFMRVVHAEMAAILSCARRGVSLKKATLFSTTFPCHECAKHIVAAGIHQVVFIDPYPKSRVGELFQKIILVDEGEKQDHVCFRAFVGVAPRLYNKVFSMPKRKDDGGRWLDWEAIRQQQQPRRGNEMVAYGDREDKNVQELNRLIRAAESKGVLMESQDDAQGLEGEYGIRHRSGARVARRKEKPRGESRTGRARKVKK